MEHELTPEEIKGFVTCMYNEEWWVSCVLQVSEDSEQVRVSFLHPNGPSRSFKYPARPDILTIPVGDVLTRVDPRTAKGRTYTLTQRECKLHQKNFICGIFRLSCIVIVFQLHHTCVLLLTSCHTRIYIS